MQYLTEQNITRLLAFIGAIATLANMASLAFHKDSTAGKWLAWFASMPIKAAPGKVKLPIDTAGALVLIACSSLLLPLCTGCQFWRDNKSEILADAEKWCVIALTATPEVKAEAAVRKLTGNQWATLLCQLPDIVEPYLIEAAETATPKAIVSAKSKGLVK